MKSLTTNLLTIFVVLFFCNGLHADLVIGFGPAPLTLGNGTTSVDVFVSSNAMDILGGFNARFRIEQMGAGTGILEFSNSQSTSEISDGNYVFPSSSAFTFSSERDGIVNTDLLHSDFAITPVTIESTSRLIGTLEMTFTGIGVDDQFEISLVHPNANTSFSDAAFGGSPLAFSSGIGTVAVPEPSAALFFAIVLAVLAGWKTIAWMFNKCKQRPIVATVERVFNPPIVTP